MRAVRPKITRTSRVLRVSIGVLLGLAMTQTGSGYFTVAQGSPVVTADVRLGREVYLANCVACHQLSGAGVRSSVPPLAGSVPELMAVDGGRQYLLNAVINGVSGELWVAGERFDGLMPSWRQLEDEQLAAVLNYIAYDWGNVAQLPQGAVAFTPFEVAAKRTKLILPREISRSRPATTD